MNTNWVLGIVAGLVLAAAGVPLWGQNYSQVGNEATAPSATSMTPLYRSTTGST